MPIIAAAIVTAHGKILLSRQFMDAARIRIEGLVAAFPKLVAGASKQSTYIDNGSVRYVYQPVEGMFLVLVTTRLSNIVEDLATLRLLGRLVNEQAGTTPDELTIQTKAFDIAFAMDEVITNGAREAVTLESVLAALSMQSHEEEKAKAEEAAAIEKAKKEARRKAHEIKAKKMDHALSGMGDSSQGGGGNGGFGGNAGGGGSSAASAPSRPDAIVIDTNVPSAKPASVGGMSLSKAGRKQDQASRVLSEAGVAPSTPANAAAASAAATSAPSSSGGDSGAPVTLKIEEKLSAQLNRDGGVSSVDIRGDLIIYVSDPSVASLRIRLGQLNQDEFGFKTHPNINKALFQTDSVLVSKDVKPFPLHQSLGILRWRAQALTRTKLPLSVNCWPSDDSASIEFELENPNMVLSNVCIAIPLGGAFPTVEDLEVGSYRHDSGSSILFWDIPLIDRRSSSGTMTIALNRAAQGSFFPTRINFQAAQSVAGVQVVEAVHAETGRTVAVGVDVSVTTDEYVVL